MENNYCYANTNILKNKLNIKKQEELDEAEVQIFSLNLYLLNNNSNFIKKTYDIAHIKSIHKFLFGDLYEWAGEFRTVNMYKEERVLGGASVEYSDYSQIQKMLKKSISDANNIDWKNSNDEEIIDSIVDVLTDIWEIHPFREGNTRTIIVFIEHFLNSKGITLNTELLKNNSFYVRDSLVLSTYDIPVHLRKIIEDAINNTSEKIYIKTKYNNKKYEVPKKYYK